MKSPFRSITNQLLVRTPCLPVATIVVENDHINTMRQRLRELVANPAIREALVIASQSLDTGINDWLADPFANKNRAIERALLRYLTRMSTRSTPFGLFSACAVGSFGEATNLTLGPHALWQRRTRIDNDYLYDAMLALGQDHSIRARLTYRPNDTGYIAAAKLRYAEARTTSAGGRTYFLMSAARTDYLQAILTRASQGATIAELTEVLLADPEITAAEAEEFLHELIDAQVLTSQLMPNVTGREPTLQLADLLQTTSETGHKAAAVLRQAHQNIEQLDAMPMGSAPHTYGAVIEQLSAEMPGGVKAPTNISRTFQVDLYAKLTAPHVGNKVLESIHRAATMLAQIAYVSTDLNKEFRNSFAEKFESQAVPLAVALDAEVGVRHGDARSGAESPLMAGVRLPGGRPGPVTYQVSPKGRWVSEMYERLLRTGAKELVLTDEDVAAAPKNTTNVVPYLGSSCAMLSVAAPSQAALDEGNFQIRMLGMLGPSGVNLLGRFCHGSEDIHQLALAQISAEESLRPHAIFAEIVHLPQGRIGNILFRPVLRKYEIPYLGIGGAGEAYQLPVSDLFVSVEAGRIVLRSKRLGREIIPRLSTAHNFDHSGSFPLYRFLASIQSQHSVEPGWSWGMLGSRRHLPRVSYNNIVLARATWNLGEADLKGINTATDGYKKVAGEPQAAAATKLAHEAVTDLRKRLELPRWVLLSSGDNELAVDLDNPAMTEMLAHELRGAKDASLVEMFPAPDQSWIAGPGGTFVHEMMVPLFRDPEGATVPVAAQGPTSNPPVAATAPQPQPPPPATTPTPALTARAAAKLAMVPRDSRLLAVGTECLYLKVYCGQTVANSVLREALVPLMATPSFRGAFEDWFFLRYADPDNHVRLRFFGEPQRLLTEVLPALSQALGPMLAEGSIDKIMLDTYQREVERYGGLEGVKLAEQLFSRDSDVALSFLEHTDDDAIPEVLWPMSLVSVDQILEDFGFTLAQKLAKAERLSEGFLAEFNMTAAWQKQLGDKFKAHRNDIAQAFSDPAENAEHIAPPIYAAIKARSERNRAVIASLRDVEAKGLLNAPANDILDSVIHVNLNRLFTHSQRAQEMVVYDLLRRYYDGILARQRKAATAPSAK